MTPTIGTGLRQNAGRIGGAKMRGALAHLWQGPHRRAEQPAQFRVPAQFADVEQQGAAGVGEVRGKHLSAREPVDEIGVHCAQDRRAGLEFGGEGGLVLDQPPDF